MVSLPEKSAVSFGSQQRGALQVIELLRAGILSPQLVDRMSIADERGRESELNAIRILRTLPYVTQVQDQPNLSDIHLMRRIDLLVQLRGRRKGSVYVQVKSSQYRVDEYITGTMAMNGLKSRGKALRKLISERIIVLNANASLADNSIILDFEQQLYDIERA